MKHTKKNLGGNKLEYRVEVAADDVTKHHEAAVKKLSRDVKVAGFRKGRVPPEVAAKHVDPSALADEAVNATINAALVELITLEQLQLLDRPEIAVTKFVPAQILEFTAVVQIVPPVKLANPAKLKAKKSAVKIGDSDIDEVLENLRRQAAEKKPVKRAAADGDEVLIDFTGTKDGVEFDGGRSTDYTLVLGSNSFIPGFEAGIVGRKSGDKFDLAVKFPSDYGVKDLAGADVIFAIVLKEVREVKSPKLDDKFASQVAPDFKTLDDLRRDIERELAARAEHEATQKFEDDLLSELAEKSSVEVPDVLVDDQLGALEQQFTQNLMYRGLTLDKFLEDQELTRDEWLEKELRPMAEKRVRNSMVMVALARQWDIAATDEEVAARQSAMMTQYNDPTLIERFKDPEMARQIAQQIVAEKTLRRLAELNQ
ncbi:trigger factor [Candidatus Saccharibacteria bacterium]|nr:trigger factor [Candidatus Saccharibacteria bacterium]